MAQESKIEWTDTTWNPVRGCSRISPGCLNCYAETLAARFSDEGQPFHLFAEREPKPHWTGRVELIEDKLLEPLRWRKPRKVFVNSMSDLFHEALPDEAIDRVFAVMALTPHITYQVLTKRAARMAQWVKSRTGTGLDVRVYRHIPREKRPLGDAFPAWPLSNVWLGVSVEDQPRADERIPDLLATPAAVRFVSYEPALGPVDFLPYLPSLDWIIVGGESGPGARPFDVAWARNTVAQCRAAGVPVFVKQLGRKPIVCDPIAQDGRRASVYEWPGNPSWIRTRKPGLDGWRLKLRNKKGGDMSEWPEDLRVREFPGGAAK